MKKKITSLLLVLAVVLSVLPARIVEASYDDTDNALGMMYTAELSDDLKAYTIDNKLLTRIYGAPSQNAFWDQFSDSFFYDNMNSTQRAYYDRLMRAASSIMYSNTDALYVKVKSGSGVYERISVLPGVSYSGLTDKEALDIFMIFSNANPHFYFLGGGMVFSEDNYAYGLIYEEYADGYTRSGYTENFSKKLEQWIQEVDKGATAIEKERNIYELLAKNLTYATYSRDEWAPYQSSSSAVFTGYTVCAGYSEAFALLAKAVGIKVLVVTSKTHEWNKVKIGDYWYNVDITNDDNGYSPSWKYFNVSDRVLVGSNDYEIESYYKTFGAPNCPYNYGEEPVKNTDQKPVAKPDALPKPASTPKTPMYRLLNPISFEHLYTRDLNEKQTLEMSGWIYEGEAWQAPLTDKGYEPVYRVFNPLTGEHHYTMDANEIKILCGTNGWIDEGIKWYSFDKTGVPVFRLYNPQLPGAGSHHYTTDETERFLLANSGWKDEGICWYGVK